jgi:hypothetical protein
MRSSGKAIGQSVGRMIFAGQSSKRIEHNLNKVGAEKISAALSKRGVSGIEMKDIAEAMTGKQRGRAGWSQGKLTHVVEALQEVGIAHAEKSASHMVLQAAKNLEPATVMEPHLSEAQLKAKFKEEARERREEANAEEAESHPIGVLERARSAIGPANVAMPEPPGQETSIRETRDQLRKSIELKPEIRIPKPKNPFNPGTGFQA